MFTGRRKARSTRLLSIGTVIASLGLALRAVPAAAGRKKEETPPVVVAPSVFDDLHEWNVTFGAGFAHEFNRSAADTQLLWSSFRWGHVFAHNKGDRWHHGAWQFGVEVNPALIVFQQSTVYGAGITPTLRRLFNPKGRFVPTFSIGLGVLFTADPVPANETKFNYTPQFTVGALYFLEPRKALLVEYRGHHISNNGRTARNPGINSSTVTVGFSWFR